METREDDGGGAGFETMEGFQSSHVVEHPILRRLLHSRKEEDFGSQRKVKVPVVGL